MRVLLIQPPSNISFIDQVYMHEPLALEYLGAGLQLDNHTVMLLDGRLETELLQKGKAFRPDIVALTGYTSQVHTIIELAKQFKTLTPAPFVIVGGHHATVKPKDFNVQGVDLIAIGEGVTTLREVANQLQQSDNFETIDGLAIPGEHLQFTNPRPHCSLDSLPTPDRTLTTHYRKHYFSEWLQPLASIRTSLGCVGRCSFCALWSLTEGRYLKRNPQTVVDELQTITEKNVFFCDDESMCDVKRMDQLADLIRNNGIQKHYFLYARADTIVRHPQLFSKWRDIGLRQVFVGMESFSDSKLRAMNKGITIDHQEQAVQILRELGITLYASFVVDPDFAKEDFKALTRYVRRLKLQHASFSILTPLPGTQMWADKQAELLPYDPQLFDFIHTVLPTRLPLAEFYTEFARLWQQAIPLHRAIRTFSLYGWRKLPGIFKLLHRATATMQRAHLDHS